MAKELKVPLKLDTVEAKRSADEMKQSLQGVGTQGGASMRSLNSVLGAVGISMGAAGLIGILRSVHEEIVRINDATAEAGRQAADLMMTGAQRLTQPSVRAAARMTGWAAGDVVARGVQAEMDYGVQETDYYGLLSSIWAAAIPDEQKAQVLEEAMTLWPAEAVAGKTASNLVLDIAARPGGETTEGRRRMLGQATAAAGASRWESPEFTAAMLKAGPEMEAAGLGYEEQLAWLGRASGGLPADPLRGTNALLQIARLAYAANSPKLQDLLQARGYRRQSGNMAEIFDAVVGYLEDAPTMEDREARQKELITEMQIPKEVIGALFLMSSDAAVAAEAKVREAVSTGAYGDIEARAADVLGQPEQGMLAGAAAGRLPPTEMGEAGSSLEANRLLREATGRLRAVPGYSQQFLDFRRAQEGRFGGGEAPQGEMMEELFRLNQLYPTVRAALMSVAGVQGDTTYLFGLGERRAGNIVAGEAESLIVGLRMARKSANKYQFIGEQRDKLSGYRNAMEAAIQFLRRLEAGVGIDYTTVGVFRNRVEQMEGTAGEREAAGQGLETIVPPAGAALGAGAQSSLGIGGSPINIGVFYGNTRRELATNPYTRLGRVG